MAPQKRAVNRECLHSERFSALLRPMVNAIEAECPQIRDEKHQRLLRQAHEVLAQLAELEEGDYESGT
jgi:hypothetical protein